MLSTLSPVTFMLSPIISQPTISFSPSFPPSSFHPIFPYHQVMPATSSDSRRFSLDLNALQSHRHRSASPVSIHMARSPVTEHLVEHAAKFRKLDLNCPSVQARPKSIIGWPQAVRSPTSTLSSDPVLLHKKSPVAFSGRLLFPDLISPSSLASLLRSSGPFQHSVSDACSTASDASYTSNSTISDSVNSDQVPKLVLIDVRSPYCFTRSRIRGAVLAHCSSKLKVRRAIQVVNELFSYDQEDDKEQNNTDVILYTDSTAVFRDSDPIVFLIQHLQRMKKTVRVLEGGFKEFHQCYGDLCVGDPCQLSTPTNPESRSDPKDIFKAKVSQIFPFLYLGNEIDAHDADLLSRLEVGHVLNVTTQLPFVDEERFQCCRLPASDCNLQDLKQHFTTAFQFIENARLSNTRVLIHCQAGVSRSATVVIAYIMAHSSLSLHQAYQLVKKRRAIISPNFSFLGQLLQFEEDLAAGRFPRHPILHECGVISLPSTPCDDALSPLVSSTAPNAFTDNLATRSNPHC